MQILVISLKGGGVGQYTKHPHSRHRAQSICNITSKEALTWTLQKSLQWATLIAGYKECDQFSSPSTDFSWPFFRFLEQMWSIRATEESRNVLRMGCPGVAPFPSKQSGWIRLGLERNPIFKCLNTYIYIYIHTYVQSSFHSLRLDY